MSVVPTQMIPGALANGVDSLKALTPERIKLKPVNQAQQYTKNGINKISFRLPSYSNSFLDTSKSFLTYTLGYTTPTTVNAVDCCSPINNACPFDRLVVKTSSGLILDDVGGYNILTAMKSQMLPLGNYMNDLEGRTSVSMESGVHSPDYSIRREFKDVGVQYRHQVQAGVLAATTAKWIPVGMCDGGAGYAFDLDLYLGETSGVIKQFGSVTTPEYFVKDVIFHLELRRADESLCKRFSEVACDGDKEILIPFSTMHHHQHSLSSPGQNLVRIHESASNLKRIFNVNLLATDLSTLALQRAYGFLGLKGIVNKFNCRVGSKWMYSEPIETSTELIMHLKNSLGMSDVPLWLEQISTGTITGGAAHHSFADTLKSVSCVDFGYSNEKFLDGINSNTPVEFHLYTRPSYVSGEIMSHFFSELNYNLSIRQGQVTYTEPKPGVGFVY